MEYMLEDGDLQKIAVMIAEKVESRCAICAKDIDALLDKKDALIYGSFGLVAFAVMIKYVPMIDKEIFNRFINLILVGLSAYSYVWFKKKIEKRQEKYFLGLLLLVTIYLLAPKTLDLLIQKLIPAYFQ